MKDKRIAVRLDQKLYDKLKKAADKAKRKISDFVRLLVEEAVK